MFAFTLRHRLHDERAVRGGNELRVRKPLAQVAHQLPLPTRVQVQVDFIHDADRGSASGVRTFGVALDHSAGEIDHPSDESLVAVADAPPRTQPYGVWNSTAVVGLPSFGWSKTGIADIGQDFGEQLLHLLETALELLLLRLAGGVIQLEKPLLRISQGSVLRKKGREGAFTRLARRPRGTCPAACAVRATRGYRLAPRRVECDLFSFVLKFQAPLIDDRTRQVTR